MKSPNSSPERKDGREVRSRSNSVERNIMREYWRPVKENPHDFDSWTTLLKAIEKQDDERNAREAYDGFLRRYPYCYGYWKKYADFERLHKHYEKCLAVYERGLEAIALSIDLWLSYIAFVKEIAQGQRQATSKIRDVYMRALEACGLEFRSDRLWEEYIEWEIGNNELEKASVLYDVLIITPTANYQQNFEKYKNFINSHEPDKVLTPEEYEELGKNVFNRVKDHLDGRAMFVVEEYEELVPPDEQSAGGVKVEATRMAQKRKHHESALRAFREEIIGRRYKRYVESEKDVSARWPYESGIKRPYFHVKPLEREQIRNWHAYLDFEMKQKKKSRILFLFERCMIACALYDEMWVKYAAYLESIDDVATARSVYKRAIETHCSRKPGIHLAFSAFEEKHSGSEAALTILNEFDRRHPDYSAVILRQIAIERRKIQKSESTDYSTVIAKYERLIQDHSYSRKLASYYSLKLARFHARVRHDRKLARKIIKEAISRDQDNVQLYLQLVDLVYNSSHPRDSDIIAAFDVALESRELPPEDRYQFSLRKLEYLEELGCDPSKLHQHIAHHLALEKSFVIPPPATIFHGKRIPLNKDGNSVESPPEKKMRVDGPISQPFIDAVAVQQQQHQNQHLLLPQQFPAHQSQQQPMGVVVTVPTMQHPQQQMVVAQTATVASMIQSAVVTNPAPVPVPAVIPPSQQPSVVMNSTGVGTASAIVNSQQQQQQQLPIVTGIPPFNPAVLQQQPANSTIPQINSACTTNQFVA